GERFKNIYQSGYLVGQFDIDLHVMQHGDFTELDAGFDFYAPQTFEGKDGVRILIGWMGLPDTEYPTDEEGWAHCLTIPRELSVDNGILKQRPLKALQHLR
ncbi:sucrose-6-phosphate hydrolase, partial [Staphylococcus auricularis]